MESKQVESVGWAWGDVIRSNRLNWSYYNGMEGLLITMEQQVPSMANRSVRFWCRTSEKTEREYAFRSLGESLDTIRGADSATKAVIVIDRFRRCNADAYRENAIYEWPPVTPKERCKQCFDCGAPGSSWCTVCGLVLCCGTDDKGVSCITEQPLTSGENAKPALSTCQRCSDYSQKRSLARRCLRSATAAIFRSMLGGTSLSLSLAKVDPVLETYSDCAGCAEMFSLVSLRHHCHACGRILCARCLCGSKACLAMGRCPHKADLPDYGWEGRVKVCKDCIPMCLARDAARNVTASAVKSGLVHADHTFRVMRYLDDPRTLPLYTQNIVDTASKKAVRAGSMAVAGIQMLSPLLNVKLAMGAKAVHAAWNHGQYAMLGLFFSEDIIKGINSLTMLSRDLRAVSPRDLIVGMMYLAAEERKQSRSMPEQDYNEAMKFGRPVDQATLQYYIDLAGVGMLIPYEENAFDAQRLALQQNWRLVTERLSTSAKHKPAWALYIHQDNNVKTAVVGIRGTDINKSLGGDIFTDVDAIPQRCLGEDGERLIGHKGMLAAARAIEPELRCALRVLAAADYTIILVGHSLGAGVAAILLWLLKHGCDGQRMPKSAKLLGVGYATPAVVDRDTSEAMKSYFTSIVNSADIVPRLTVASLNTFKKHVVKCAHKSKSDLHQDVEGFLDRVVSFWAPKLRSGLPQDSSMHTTEHGENCEITKDKNQNDCEGEWLSGTRRTLTGFLAPRTESAEHNGENGAATVDSSPLTRVLEGLEGTEVWIPGGSESVVESWFGDPAKPWQDKEGAGRICTQVLMSNIKPDQTISVSKSLFGDPCPGVQKVLLIFTDGGQVEEMFVPGAVTRIYRRNGSLEAARVPCDLPSLRRISCDARFLEDHKMVSYHRALLTVSARMRAKQTVTWQSFTEAPESCPCCHNRYDWPSSTKSELQRYHWMTNCRRCGRVVCTSCASARVGMEELGIIDPARVCDECMWPGRGQSLGMVHEIYAAASRCKDEAV